MLGLGYSGFESGSWVGVFLPARTPAPIVKRLEDALQKGMADPEYVDAMTRYGYKTNHLTQPQFASMVCSESTRCSELIKKAGIKLD